MSNPLIVNAAITGCVLKKSEHPELPVSVEEITRCVREVVDEGASIVHLHARNPDDSASHSAQDYIDIVTSVRKACPEVVVCVSLSGRFANSVELRAAPLEAGPDMASLTLGSLNFPTQASLNSPDTVVQLARRIFEAGAIPELEVFEAGMLHYSKYLIKQGILKGPLYYNLILGSLGTAPLDLVGLGHMVSMLPDGALWSVGGIGRHQLQANALAIASGGHVRVGLEDNPYFDWTRRQPTSNRQLVARVVRLARELGREPATPTQVRQLLGLPQVTPSCMASKGS